MRIGVIDVFLGFIIVFGHSVERVRYCVLFGTPVGRGEPVDMENAASDPSTRSVFSSVRHIYLSRLKYRPARKEEQRDIKIAI